MEVVTTDMHWINKQQIVFTSLWANTAHLHRYVVYYTSYAIVVIRIGYISFSCLLSTHIDKSSLLLLNHLITTICIGLT